MKETLAKGISAALALGLIAPGMAFAADADHTPAVTGEDVKVTAAEEGGSEGTTAVTWVADDSQLDITVPNTIHVVAKADGTPMVPTNAAISNNSVFAVHGTKYVTADAGITLVEDVAAEDGSKDVMEMQVTATGAAMQMGPAGEHAIAVGDLNLNKESAATLGLAGKVKLANDPATAPTDAFTVEWHFQAGLAKESTVQIDADAFKQALNETIRVVNFGTASTGNGVALDENGVVKADQVGDTLNITVAENTIIQLPEDCSQLMNASNGGSNIESVNGSVDTSLVKNMSNMFDGDTKLSNIDDLSDWDTSNVDDMTGIFAGCENIDGSVLENWQVKGGAITNGAFDNGSDTTPGWYEEVQYAKSKINTDLLSQESVVFMPTNVVFLTGNQVLPGEMDKKENIGSSGSYVYAYKIKNDDKTLYIQPKDKNSICSAEENFQMAFGNGWINLVSVTGTLDLTETKDISNLFRQCENLQDISFFKNTDIPNVTDMITTFYCCSKLTDLSPLENLNVSNVANMLSAFEYCSSLTNASIESIRNWECSENCDFTNMFLGTGVSSYPDWYK